MSKKKKRTIIISGIITILLIAPQIVLAVMYQSSKRENKFHPAQANVQVQEGNQSSDELINTDYTWTASGDNYTVTKPVEIIDVRGKNDEYLRVRFIPMWYDTDGNVVGGADEFSDFSNINLVGDELQFKKSDNSKVLLTLKLYTDNADSENNWNNDWRYDSSEQCFYYKGKIQSGDISNKLLSGAQIPKAVYDATKDQYTLHIEVLADAIQTGGDANDDRW
jgi:hypothetical protein